MIKNKLDFVSQLILKQSLKRLKHLLVSLVLYLPVTVALWQTSLFRRNKKIKKKINQVLYQ